MKKLTKQQRIDKALKEYKKIKDLAWEEYNKIENPAWEEYGKILEEIESEPDEPVKRCSKCGQEIK